MSYANDAETILFIPYSFISYSFHCDLLHFVESDVFTLVASRKIRRRRILRLNWKTILHARVCKINYVKGKVYMPNSVRQEEP